MKKILIVDDKKDNLYLLDVLLKSIGHAVIQAHNGHEALEMARQHQPDLIISDILMPGMDGFGLCRKVKNDAALGQLPFIFYTATYTDEKDEVYALSLGADRFVRKPMQPDLFLNQITGLINEYENSAQPVREPIAMEEEESYKLYSERLIQKLEKKMLDLEKEIEHRIKVEQELRCARNEWEETFQAIASPALLLDTEYNIIHANRSATHALQKTDNEVIGKKCFDLFHHAGQPQHDCPMAHLIDTGAPQSVEIEVDALGGHYLISCAPLTNDRGKIEKIIHIAVDITQRKQVEVKLKQSEERFRQLVENINELFWIREAHSREILYISPIYEKMFGLPIEDMYRDPYAFMKAVMDEDLPIIKRAHQDQMHRGKSTDIIFRIIKGDELRWIRSKTFPIRDENETVVRIAGIAEDITAAKKSEAEQKRLEGQLVQVQRLEAMGTLAGGIAHDFNNILSSIIGFTELTLVEVEDASTAQHNLKQVLSAGFRAKELVQQILTLARKSKDTLEPVLVSLIARESTKLLRSTVSASIEIKERLDSDSFVFASAAQLHQVFINLLTNAAQAMRRNGGVLEIGLSDVTLDKSPTGRTEDFIPGSYIEVTISDSGEGIPQESIDDIFNPYFTTKDVGEGTGLGLSITHGIIKNCGGHILVHSVVGMGTIFTLYLPISVTQAELHPSKNASLPTGTERILVVDDEPSIADLTIQQLERLGYTVTSRTSSPETLELFKSGPDGFDLVISDMAMPKMTGDLLARELLKIRPDLPIILCTGYSKRITDEMAAQIGIKSYAMKPLAMEDLAIKVRNALDGKQTSSERMK